MEFARGISSIRCAITPLGSGSALPVAEDQAVEINLLRLAEPFV